MARRSKDFEAWCLENGKEDSFLSGMKRKIHFLLKLYRIILQHLFIGNAKKGMNGEAPS